MNGKHTGEIILRIRKIKRQNFTVKQFIQISIELLKTKRQNQTAIYLAVNMTEELVLLADNFENGGEDVGREPGEIHLLENFFLPGDEKL